MKKIIAGLAVIIMGVSSVNAQQLEQTSAPKHHRHQRHTPEKMSTALHFSDAQKTQLTAINNDYHKKLAVLLKNEDITVRSSREQLKTLREEHRQQIKALLTPDQQQQLAKLKEEHSQQAKARMTARVEKIKTKLGLSDAQAAQLKDMRTGMMTKIKSVRTDSSLSRNQKHEQIKAIAMQQKDQLKTILTPDQMQQLEQMRQHHPQQGFTK